MDDDLKTSIAEMSAKLDEVYRTVERLRKFFMWTLIITAVCFILPLIGLAFAIPSYLNTLSGLSSI